MTTTVCIFKDTIKISEIESENSGLAWKTAIRAVRFYAAEDGFSASKRAEWLRPRGRFVYKVGPFQAISKFRKEGQ